MLGNGNGNALIYRAHNTIKKRAHAQAYIPSISIPTHCVFQPLP